VHLKTIFGSLSFARAAIARRDLEWIREHARPAEPTARWKRVTDQNRCFCALLIRDTNRPAARYPPRLFSPISPTRAGRSRSRQRRGEPDSTSPGPALVCPLSPCRLAWALSRLPAGQSAIAASAQPPHIWRRLSGSISDSFLPFHRSLSLCLLDPSDLSSKTQISRR
jgi:hypothetical protein